jgi:hypothetical protein
MAQTTKRFILDQAFDEIGLAGYVFNLSGSDLMSAIYKLDAMVASWESLSTSIGWVFSANPLDSDPDQQITVPDAALQPLIANLAVRLAPAFGKQVSIETKSAAIMGLNALRTRFVSIPDKVYPDNLPIGTGNRLPLSNNFYPVTNPLEVNGGELDV